MLMNPNTHSQALAIHDAAEGLGGLFMPPPRGLSTARMPRGLARVCCCLPSSTPSHHFYTPTTPVSTTSPPVPLPDLCCCLQSLRRPGPAPQACAAPAWRARGIVMAGQEQDAMHVTTSDSD